MRNLVDIAGVPSDLQETNTLRTFELTITHTPFKSIRARYLGIRITNAGDNSNIQVWDHMPHFKAELYIVHII